MYQTYAEIKETYKDLDELNEVAAPKDKVKYDDDQHFTKLFSRLEAKKPIIVIKDEEFLDDITDDESHIAPLNQKSNTPPVLLPLHQKDSHYHSC